MQHFQAICVSFSTSLCTCFVQVPLAPHTEAVAFIITANVTLFTAMFPVLSQLHQHTHHNLSLMHKLTRTFLMLQWQRLSKTVSHAISSPIVKLLFFFSSLHKRLCVIYSEATVRAYIKPDAQFKYKASLLQPKIKLQCKFEMRTLVLLSADLRMCSSTIKCA